MFDGKVQCEAHLRPLAGLEAAVRVDPEQLLVASQQADIQEGLNLLLNELHSVHTNVAHSQHMRRIQTKAPRIPTGQAISAQQVLATVSERDAGG